METISRCAATSIHSPDPAIITYVLARCTVKEIHSNRSRNRYEKHSTGNMRRGGMKAIRMMMMGGMETKGEEEERRTEESAKGM
jgi:hypothetical protein